MQGAVGAVNGVFQDTSKFCGVFSEDGEDLRDVFYDNCMQEFFYKDKDGRIVSIGRLDHPANGHHLGPNVLPPARRDNIYKFAKGTYGRVYTDMGMLLFEPGNKKGQYLLTLNAYDGSLKLTVGGFCPELCVMP